MQVHGMRQGNGRTKFIPPRRYLKLHFVRMGWSINNQLYYLLYYLLRILIKLDGSSLYVQLRGQINGLNKQEIGKKLQRTEYD